MAPVVDTDPMGLKSSIDWAKNEWGIFRRGSEMRTTERVRWLRQWVPFGARTAGWAVVSLTGGPLTQGRVSVWAARKWSQSSAKSLKIDIRTAGGENVPEGALIYMSNHESLVDILVLGAALPGDFKWAAKRSVMNVPFLGWHLRSAGHIPVDRGRGKEAAAAVVESFVDVLDRDRPILVFPEGTRTEDGHLRPFKDGGFRAAVEANCPVVPVAIQGTYTLMSRDSVDTGTARGNDPDRVVTVEIGAPIYPVAELAKEERVADLRDRTRQAVVGLKARAVAAKTGVESTQRP